MKTVYILCEGQAEQHFVQEILTDIAEKKGIYIYAPLVTTKVANKKFVGGVASYSKIRNDLVKLCNHSEAIVTTMFDLYGLPKDTPGYSAPQQSHYDWAVSIETAVNADIGTRNIHFNLVVHEFEALLFTNPSVFRDYNKDVVEVMEKSLRSANGNPESINSGYDTSPSHRITRVYQGYSKPITGVIMAKRIGLDRIRASCHHFNEWLISLGL